jgi:transposase
LWHLSRAQQRITGHVLHSGTVIKHASQGFASLLRALPEVLEDGDNELPDLYRPTLHRMYTRLLELREDIEAMTKEVELLVNAHPVCSRLTALEGIGPIGALLLYAVMGSGTAFKNAREFAAYLGLVPRQYSSAGKTNIVGLSKCGLEQEGW